MDDDSRLIRNIMIIIALVIAAFACVGLSAPPIKEEPHPSDLYNQNKRILEHLYRIESTLKEELQKINVQPPPPEPQPEMPLSAFDIGSNRRVCYNYHLVEQTK